MNVRERLGALLRDIRTDLCACQQLENLLLEQQRLLSRQEGQALTDLGQSILSHIDGIRQRAGDRAGHLQALGLPAGTEGIAILATKLPDSIRGPLLRDWEALEKALSRCKTLNERNGELLASHRAALATLTGQPLNQYGHESG